MIPFRELIKKEIKPILLLISFLVLAFTTQPGFGEEPDEDSDEGTPIIVVVHPRIVAIEKEGLVETVITLLNLGNKPISLGRVDHKTGRMVNGDCELRLSVDMGDAPLRHIQVGGMVIVSNDTPFMSANLINGVTLMPGSMLWMRVTALPAQDIKVSQHGDAKFTFTLLGSFDGKIKTMIVMGFSVRYEKEKHTDYPRLIQASNAVMMPQGSKHYKPN